MSTVLPISAFASIVVVILVHTLRRFLILTFGDRNNIYGPRNLNFIWLCLNKTDIPLVNLIKETPYLISPYRIIFPLLMIYKLFDSIMSNNSWETMKQFKSKMRWVSDSHAKISQCIITHWDTYTELPIKQSNSNVFCSPYISPTWRKISAIVTFQSLRKWPTEIHTSHTAVVRIFQHIISFHNKVFSLFFALILVSLISRWVQLVGAHSHSNNSRIASTKIVNGTYFINALCADKSSLKCCKTDCNSDASLRTHKKTS